MSVITQMITCLPRLKPHRPWPSHSAGKTSASTCSTWKGKPTKNSSKPDPLEDALEDLVRAAQQDLDGASRMEAESEDSGELVERPDFVTLIMIKPGYCLKDFKVKVVGVELRVDAPDFEVRRTLGCRVESSRVRTDYRNGVLSVRVEKKF